MRECLSKSFINGGTRAPLWRLSWRQPTNGLPAMGAASLASLSSATSTACFVQTSKSGQVHASQPLPPTDAAKNAPVPPEASGETSQSIESAFEDSQCAP